MTQGGRKKGSGGRREGAGRKPGKWRRDTESRGLTLTDALWDMIERAAEKRRMRRSKFLEMIFDGVIEKDEIWDGSGEASIPLAKIPRLLMGPSRVLIIALTAGLWKELDDLADTKFRALLGREEDSPFKAKTNECIEYILLCEFSRPESERVARIPRVERELMLSAGTWERLRAAALKERMPLNSLVEKLLKNSDLVFPPPSGSQLAWEEPDNKGNGEGQREGQKAWKVRLPAWVWRRAEKAVASAEGVDSADLIEALLIKSMNSVGM